MLSSDPNSPFIDGSGRDDVGKGSRILSSVLLWSVREFCLNIPVELLSKKLFCCLGVVLGVSLWKESGVSAPSRSNQLDSEEERSRGFFYSDKRKC